jgi:hypothetical protein
VHLAVTRHRLRDSYPLVRWISRFASSASLGCCCEAPEWLTTMLLASTSCVGMLAEVLLLASEPPDAPEQACLDSRTSPPSTPSKVLGDGVRE